MSHREASPGPLAAGLRPVSREDGPLMVPVDTAYNPAEWGTFAVGFTTASGALTGLVFVAVSV